MFAKHINEKSFVSEYKKNSEVKNKRNYWTRDSRPLHKDTYFLHHPSSVSIQVPFMDKEMEA